MSINKLIKDTLEPLGLPVRQDVYDGNEDKWITYNYADDRGIEFVDDEPVTDEIEIQIHLFVPFEFNYLSMKRNIRRALIGAGFSYPTVHVFYEDDTDIRHIVFECSIINESEV